MLEKAAGVEGRELSPGERQAQLEKYRFRFVNIYQELEMSSRFVDTHRDVSQGGDGVQLHSHTFYEMIYCTGGSTQYLLGTQRYRLRHGDIVLIPPGVSHRPLLAEKWPIHTGAALYGSARNMWKASARCGRSC